MRHFPNCIRETHIVGPHTREEMVGSHLCPALAHEHIHIVGRSQAKHGFEFVRLHPGIAQILACTSGWGWVWVNQQWTRCGPGQAYLTPPHTKHAYHAPPPPPRSTRSAPTWNVCWLIVSAQHAESLFGTLSTPTLVAADTEPLDTAIAGLHRESIAHGDPAAQAQWVNLIRHYARRIVLPIERDPRLVSLWRQVATDLARPWTLPLLARHASISPEHLRRLCHNAYGTSPIRQVALLRAHRAAELLGSTPMKIETIASLVGYSNPFSFSTAFTRALGRPPSAFRPPKPHEKPLHPSPPITKITPR